MKYIEMPDADYLNSILRYDADSGKLFWKKRIANCVNVGTEAGWMASKYLQVTIKGKHYYVHRIIWHMVHGNLSSSLQIEHDDRDRINNRISNLYMVTQSTNMKNQSIPKNNISGVIGVSFHKHSDMWCSKICNNKIKEQTYHKTKEQAIDWRKQKEFEYGFHAQHGKSAKR